MCHPRALFCFTNICNDIKLRSSVLDPLCFEFLLGIFETCSMSVLLAKTVFSWMRISMDFTLEVESLFYPLKSLIKAEILPPKIAYFSPF